MPMIIAYDDQVANDGTTLTADIDSPFAAGAPLENAKTRQLAVVARREDTDSPTQFTIDFGIGNTRTIGMFAILAHNMRGFARITWSVRGPGASVIASATQEIIWAPRLTSFPLHLFVVLSQNYFNVQDIVIVLEPEDPLTSFTAPVEFGRLWASPVWSPAVMTGRRNFRIQTRDDSVLDKADGNQAYADFKSRFRQLSCTLPLLTEAEAIGTEGSFLASIQDIAFLAGRASPVIVIPTTANNHIQHKAGIYGCFVDPPSIDLIEESAGSFEDGLKYSTEFDVVEEL